MTASLADIRRFLTESFNDEELTTLCFDHFQDVYLNFTADMTLGRKALQLVDYCRRRERVPELLSVLRKERPEAARRVFGRISKSADRRVNINTAEVDELLNLPGIGPALAAAIVAGRPFATVDNLDRVNGIGPRRLAALREWCMV
jgi:competence ComEA-like helix-hairpin-helix protein